MVVHMSSLQKWVTIYYFYNIFSKPTLLCPLKPCYEGQSLCQYFDTFINKKFQLFYFLLMQMKIWLNSWAFCQRCGCLKSKPSALEAFQNVTCSNFCPKFKNVQNCRVSYISAVCRFLRNVYDNYNFRNKIFWAPKFKRWNEKNKRTIIKISFLKFDDKILTGKSQVVKHFSFLVNFFAKKVPWIIYQWKFRSKQGWQFS